MEISCCNCQSSKTVKATAKGNPRPPRGWKNIGGVYWCGECWKEQYAIRAITLPVTGPLDCEWPELRERLKAAFALSTELANWSVRRLMLNDVIRTPDMDKLPAMPKVYLYGEAKDGFARWLEMPATSANAVLGQVEAKWRAKRYEVLWLNKDRPPAYTYPQPWPVTSQNWRFADTDQDGRLAVSVTLPGGRTELLLAGGGQYARQLAGLRHLQAHPELCCELSLIEVKANEGDNRNGDSGRGGSGGVRKRTRLMCKIVGWFPRDKGGATGELPVRSTDDAILVAVDIEGDRIWTYHADQVKRLHESHMRRLQRLADDRKAERRKPERDGRDYRAMLADISRRDRNRITTLCHEVSASVVQFARRRGYAAIRYDDTDHSFAPQFAWHKLRTMVEQKCRRDGLEFKLCANSPVTEETP